MRAPKVVVCDMDSTLVIKHQELTERAKNAIRILRNHGVYFGVASGRPIFQLRHTTDRWDIDQDLMIAMNGCELYDVLDNRHYNYFMMEPEWIKETIELFEDIESLYITSVDQKTYVEELLNIYNNLSNSQKAYITNLSKLNSSLEKIAELEQEIASDNKVNKVIELIASLDSTNVNVELVLAAKEQYDLLTEEEKAEIYNYINLELSLKIIESINNEDQLQVINEFTNLVASVISATYETKESLINAANTYYETIENKELVEVTYDLLTKEIVKFNNEKAAHVVVDKINAIGTVTAESLSLIKDAENAYNALTTEQKAYVTNLNVLEVAKLNYQALTQEVENKPNGLTIVFSVIASIASISTIVLVIKRKK